MQHCKKARCVNTTGLDNKVNSHYNYSVRLSAHAAYWLFTHALQVGSTEGIVAVGGKL